MSACNGCRILRKRCGEKCILRHCLRGISSPQAQANATVFVARFFGRVTLMSFASSVPEDQRPALFESLLNEAVGRVVNPVSGAVGLLGAGKWHECQSAVETVLRLGGSGLLLGGSENRLMGRRTFKGRPKSDKANKESNNSASPRLGLVGSAAKRTQTMTSGSCSGKGKVLKLFI